MSACDLVPVTVSELAVVPVSACELTVTTRTTHKFDIAPYVGKKLSRDEKFELLKNVHTPDANISYPMFSFGSKKRSFQHRWIARYPKLCYSSSTDGAFCLHCVLLSDDQKQGQLVKQPFCNWKKATERFDEHFSKKTHNSGDASASSHKKPGTGYKSHKTAVLKSQEFQQRCNNIQPAVNIALKPGLGR